MSTTTTKSAPTTKSTPTTKSAARPKRAKTTKRAKSVSQHVIQRAEMLNWSTRIGAVTPEALAERNQMSITNARKRLNEAVRLGHMEKHSVLVGYSPLYRVTVAGRRLAHKHAEAGGYVYPKGMPTARVTIKEARHTIACAGVAAALESRYPELRVIGERELHRDESKAGRRLASVEVPRARDDRRSHSPDLVMWEEAAPGEPVPLPVAVEVELTLKSVADLAVNVRGWAECEYIEAVLYYVETRKVENRLLDAIEQCKAEEMIVVNPLSAILKPQPGFPLDDQ
jgi:hypothetical protein